MRRSKSDYLRFHATYLSSICSISSENHGEDEQFNRIMKMTFTFSEETVNRISFNFLIDIESTFKKQVTRLMARPKRLSKLRAIVAHRPSGEMIRYALDDTGKAVSPFSRAARRDLRHELEVLGYGHPTSPLFGPLPLLTPRPLPTPLLRTPPFAIPVPWAMSTQGVVNLVVESEGRAAVPEVDVLAVQEWANPAFDLLLSAPAADAFGGTDSLSSQGDGSANDWWDYCSLTTHH
jgi:hypothetical protein